MRCKNKWHYSSAIFLFWSIKISQLQKAISPRLCPPGRKYWGRHNHKFKSGQLLWLYYKLYLVLWFSLSCTCLCDKKLYNEHQFFTKKIVGDIGFCWIVQLCFIFIYLKIELLLRMSVGCKGSVAALGSTCEMITPLIYWMNVTYFCYQISLS